MSCHEERKISLPIGTKLSFTLQEHFRDELSKYDLTLDNHIVLRYNENDLLRNQVDLKGG